jgi:polysaccharide deacetylase 2 family uncharacterized protein YibQ
MRLPGWRALGLYWLVVGAGVTGGVVWLNRLGPPEPVMAATAPAASAAQGPLADPAPTATPAPSAAVPQAPVPDDPPARQAAAPPGVASVTAAPARAAEAAPPAAPEPPVLAVAAAPAPPPAPPRAIPAPEPALLEESPHGPLPRIGPDGRTAIRAYGREFDRRDTRPRVGVIVADIGLNATHTEEAIRRLPPAVALAISPYAARPGQTAERARERGMETLISVPLEPAGYPLNNPGDRALLTGQPMAANLETLAWVLGRAQGYVGAIGAVGGMRGERFAAMPEAIGAVQDALRARGLLYVDPRPGAPAPARAWGRSVDVVLDEPAGTRGEIDRRLAELEALARERGAALGLAGAATPVVVERIAAWAAGLEARGLVMAPVSAMIRRPEGLSPEPGPLRNASAP